MKITRLLFPLLLILLFNFYAESQISISNISEVSKIKNGTTYVAMKDPGSAKSQEYIKAIKDAWTISKVEFIKYTDVEKYLSHENSFLSIGGYETNTQFIHILNHTRYNGINFSITHLYLELWTCRDKFFESKKKNKTFGNDDKIQVARIDLYTDFPTLKNPENIYQNDYDGSSHIRNWSPGILKNYIQSLSGFLNRNETRKLYAENVNVDELYKLKNETLFVPSYSLIKFNKFNGNESKHNEGEIFEDYDLKYEILTEEELSNKILTDTKPFYYLVYVKSSTDKFISVINSSTGEMVYSAYSPVSYNINSKDLKELRRKIK